MREASQGLHLQLDGLLDAEACVALRHQLASAFAAGITTVTLDLQRVEEVDLTGVGVLAGAAKHLEGHGGQLSLANASASVASSLRVNGLGRLLVRTRPLRVVRGVPDTRPATGLDSQALKQPS